ncbi:hypothetical protein SAMN05660337_1266 [Maridesulfovibrio ferrireducens]|uniref:Uncharacterized protein n=2 Tax=Maridesulfovibrio ferrireducens TaxID=246191 RepID=A0A1G9ETV9_9BACT|nr:hypothetical protein SAMN05660337_1266 [Maridesulfovibrio ferrireducens]
MIRALFRLMSYAIVVINLLSCGTFLYIIAPYTSYFFFNDLRFWKYLKYYHKYYFYSAAYIWGLLSREQGLIKTVLPLTSPPMDRPDPTLFRLSKQWTLPEDSCGECNRCCTFIVDCCFLDTSGNRCLCYGSLFWKYFNCGRFPSSQAMLNYCECPKFETRG